MDPEKEYVDQRMMVLLSNKDTTELQHIQA